MLGIAWRSKESLGAYQLEWNVQCHCHLAIVKRDFKCCVAGTHTER